MRKLLLISLFALVCAVVAAAAARVAEYFDPSQMASYAALTSDTAGSSHAQVAQVGSRQNPMVVRVAQVRMVPADWVEGDPYYASDLFSNATVPSSAALQCTTP